MVAKKTEEKAELDTYSTPKLAMLVLTCLFFSNAFGPAVIDRWRNSQEVFVADNIENIDQLVRTTFFIVLIGLIGTDRFKRI